MRSLEKQNTHLSMLNEQWKNNSSYNCLINKLNRAKLTKFITTEPRSFHPYLVAEFYQRAIIAPNEQSLTIEVHDIQFIISPQFFTEEFGMDNTGAFIPSYQDGILGVEKKHWLQQKLTNDVQKPKHNVFKLATPKGSLDYLATLMLGIMLKMIIQEVGSKAELSTRKYKPMTVFDNEVPAD